MTSVHTILITTIEKNNPNLLRPSNPTYEILYENNTYVLAYEM
jgi:hypothetical protein